MDRKMKEQIKPLFKNIPAVVFTIDNNYVPYFSVALTGLLRNISAAEQYDIVVLHQDLNDENRQILEQECAGLSNLSLRFININELIHQTGKDKFVSNIAHINEVTYFRLYIPQLFSRYKKVIFLDSDICIDGDIAGLYRIEMGKNYLAAVRGCLSVWQKNYQTLRHKSSFSFAQYTKEVLNVESADYFNAGVLVFNIQQILKDKKHKDFFEKLDILPTLAYNDQDILNMCCKDRITWLGVEWNYCSKFTFIEDAKTYDDMLTDKIKIYHYIGADKPWLNPRRRYYNIFYTYATLSPYWKNFLKQN